MADKHYRGEIGLTIIVDIGQDITTAGSYSLKVRKPGGTEVSWAASIYNTNYLKYVTETDDLDEAGTYYLQSYIEIDQWKGRGETADFDIDDIFSPDIN